MFCMQCGQEIGTEYIKKLIREELTDLDPKVADRLATQLERQLALNQRRHVAYEVNVETKDAREVKDERRF